MLLHVEEGVTIITLNRLGVLNPVDPPMGEALVRAIQACAEEGIRAVLPTDACRAFYAGGEGT
jgi:enoyl-CoA hydratase/carnithine racemase